MSFRVPEQARVTSHPLMATSSADGNNGAFVFESPISGWGLIVVASDGSAWGEAGLDGEPWEHVSVHAVSLNGKKMRCPTWLEMCWIKDRFWEPEDVVMQLHPAKSQAINEHPYTLHLWRPTKSAVPLPPLETV